MVNKANILVFLDVIFPIFTYENMSVSFFYFNLLTNDWETMMQFVYMNLHVHVEDTIIELLDTDGLSSLVGRHVNAPSFKIKGRYLGITTLYVSP
jgi:hypothetical protein